jgi:hypothetical protein
MTLGAKTIESVCELCAAEGYPYNEETCMGCEDNPHKRSDDMGCYSVGEPLHEDGTTTFEKTEGIHQRYIRIYKCTYCGLDIAFLADMCIYPLESKIDFNYCPYCGRPVEREDDINE